MKRFIASAIALVFLSCMSAIAAPTPQAADTDKMKTGKATKVETKSVKTPKVEKKAANAEKAQKKSGKKDKKSQGRTEVTTTEPAPAAPASRKK